MLRLTGGAWRGRRIPSAPVGVRPTPSRVREALMNIWTHEGLLHEPFLDLFAGSGVMGLEALSRGAPRVVAIEQRIHSVRALRALADELGLHERWEILRARLPDGLARIAQQRFGVVFADPPYAWREALTSLPAWLDDYGIRCQQLVIEQPREAALRMPPVGWRVVDTRRYGGTMIVRLTRA